jgi:ATP-dependent DNA helicase RecG
LVRIVNTDRYDDRLEVRTNLFESYDLLMDFIRKHLPDPFFPENNQRISLRDKIFREVIANTLVHHSDSPELELLTGNFTISYHK